VKIKQSYLRYCVAAVSAFLLAVFLAAAVEHAGFSDVSAEADYAQAVDWCVQQGLMNGVGEGCFDPDGVLTRGVLSTVLYRHAGEPELSGDFPNFSDVALNQWYTKAAHWANAQGIIKGYGNGVFGVTDPVSVEQLAVILDRYLGKGDTWEGDPARALAATRAQVAVALMETLHAEATITQHPAQGRSLGYLLYTPADAKTDMPLIVYLHGGSGKGEDLSSLTAVDGFPKFLSQGTLGDIPSYVLIPQLPADLKGWDNALDNLSSLLDDVCDTYQINMDKVSLTGHSMGGTGAWAVAVAMPERFSCVVPMSGSIRNTPDNVELLSDLPVWAFVGAEDNIVPPASSQQFILALQKAGANAKLTTLSNAGHFDVPNAYVNADFAVLDWMLAQSK
jgi:predicted esterase